LQAGFDKPCIHAMIGEYLRNGAAKLDLHLFFPSVHSKYTHRPEFRPAHYNVTTGSAFQYHS
jgi:hypothetical protein